MGLLQVSLGALASLYVPAQLAGLGQGSSSSFLPASEDLKYEVGMWLQFPIPTRFDLGGVPSTLRLVCFPQI